MMSFATSTIGPGKARGIYRMHEPERSAERGKAPRPSSKTGEPFLGDPLLTRRVSS